jgi:NAD(P)H-flavin reductase
MSTVARPEAVHEPEPMLPQPWTVTEVLRETADVVTLSIAPGRGAQAMHYQPGQFNMLYVFGVGEVPISISGGTDGCLLHTIRDVGGVTRALCAQRRGATVGVRGPFGSAWPIAAEIGRDIVIAAGGIGLAPLRPVIEHLCRHREDYDDAVVLYGARNPAERLFPDSYADWRRHDIQVEVTVDNANPSWPGHVGVVTQLIRRANFDASEASAFLCGPEVMMRFCALELERAGVEPARTFLSMERNMKCAIGFCGHCQLGPEFICRDGAVFPWPRMRGLINIREL